MLDYDVRRAPAHAGRLRPSEQLAFALVFTLMAGLVAAVTVTAARASHPAQAQATASASSGDGRAAVHRHGSGAASQRARGSGTVAGPAGLDARLAAAMGGVAGTDSGNVAVGVFDLTSGVQAVYHGQSHFHTASIENADILAALLLQHQRAHTALSPLESLLATQMMEYSDNDATSALWNMAGGQAGLEAANRALGLSHTHPGNDGYWGLSRSTVLDQLRLLRDLTSARSPLTRAAQSYEVSLMEAATPSQRWGIGGPGQPSAVRDGWVPDPRLWVISSEGVTQWHGQRLLIVVLSRGNRTEPAGIALVQAVARAAASVVTQA